MFLKPLFTYNSRKDDIIVAGIKITRSFAEVVEGESRKNEFNPGREETEAQTLDFLNQHGMDLREEEVSACHVLGRQKQLKMQKRRHDYDVT